MFFFYLQKDKASVLSITTEQLSALKAKVEELSRKNQMLEAEVAKGAKASAEEEEDGGGRVDVRITDAGESTSEDNRVVDLRVTVRGENGMLELVMRLLEFLKQVENVRLISVEANTRSNSVNRIILRLVIQVCINYNVFFFFFFNLLSNVIFRGRERERN